MSYYDAFKGRDPRMAQTIQGPGFIEVGETAPKQLSWERTLNGYRVIKYISDVSHEGATTSTSDFVLFRYGEVLLNYAEAMNELNLMTEDVWNSTVGALRNRAGIANIYPKSGDYSRDEWLYDYYTKNVSHPMYTKGDLDIALEIRRERVAEMTFENVS